MGNPKIGRQFAPETETPEPVVEAPAPAASAPEPAPLPPPATIAEAQIDMGHDFEFEGPLIHEGVPEPPKFLLRKFEARNLAWRWMSKPQAAKHGMRMYTTYSPDAADREAIARGDTHAGIRVSVENQITWGEDAFLATIPKRYFEMRRAEVRRLTDAQTKHAKSPDALQAAADRLGTKVTLSVQERVGRPFPDD